MMPMMMMSMMMMLMIRIQVVVVLVVLVFAHYQIVRLSISSVGRGQLYQVLFIWKDSYLNVIKRHFQSDNYRIFKLSPIFQHVPTI
jgi:hypothetical protein